MTSVKAFAPASIGNLGAGFDVLGAALKPIDGFLWGDFVEVVPLARTTPRFIITVTGPYASLLPGDMQKNLAFTCFTLFKKALFAKKKKIDHAIELVLYKNLPLCSGIGSSASSVVASLVALNGYFGSPLNKDELLVLAGKAEGTVSGSVILDNVGPSLLGGLQLIAPGRAKIDSTVPVPFFPHWRFVVVHPDLSVPTRRARAILPKKIDLSAAVAYWKNLAAFVHALHASDEDLAARTARDLLIEKYRRRLVKGFSRVQKAAMDSGALGCTLSGSGPSMFALAKSESISFKIKDSMIAAFRKAGVAAEGRICTLDTLGAREV